MIRGEQLSRVYATRRGPVKALDGVELEVAAGEFVCVRGPSGCGKTTLLLMLGGMLRPTAGRVMVDGQDVYGLAQGRRARWRAETIGFVFQMFHLAPYLSALENVLLAAPPGQGRARRPRALELLDRLGLAARASHRPGELSAGERQRAALARALLNEPKLLLADEPTGNLDPENAGVVLGQLRAFQRAGGAVVLVTHGPGPESCATRVLHLRAGRLAAASGAAAGP